MCFNDHPFLEIFKMQRRLAQIKRLLKLENQSCALLISSAPEPIRSADTHYPYRQSSNLFYLTGTSEGGVCLLVTASEKERATLFAPKVSNLKVVWEGAPENMRALAGKLGVNFVEYDESPNRELRAKLAGVEKLYYEDHPGGLAKQFVLDLMQRPLSERGRLPRTFADSDQLMARLRLFKDRDEVLKIYESARVTAEAMKNALFVLNSKSYEYQLAATIDWQFAMQRGKPAFQTIVAAGPSAATLHYHRLNRRLKNGEPVLIDCGAEVDLYAGDISRVLPVGGTFSPIATDIYSIVLEAQLAAISKVKAGVKISAVYGAAAAVLTQGLVELKILRGRVSTLLEKKAFAPYFPHGIGHSLGLDVHDIGNLRGNNQAALEEGMVFTIEPGLYFPKKIGQVPACGFRIEDDILVTKSGCKILTPQFPKVLKEVEDLCS